MANELEEFLLRHAILTKDERDQLRTIHPGEPLLAAAVSEGMVMPVLAQDAERLVAMNLHGGVEPHFDGILLLQEIGRGARGRVFRAWQENLRRLVAVKVIERSTVRDEEARRRFIREARIAARLSHPSLVRAYEIGSAADHVYIILEYVEGETLQAKIQREGKLPLADTLDIAAGIAEGLAFANANGIAHRDIKPANIQLGSKGQVKILDLGLARPEGISEMTSPLMAQGTPAYISPEQASGNAEITPKADVYALGVVIWRCLTGVHLFDAKESGDMLRAHIAKDAPLLTSARKDVPENFSVFVATMLAKDPTDRPDAPTVLGHLKLYRSQLNGQGGESKRMPRTSSQRNVRPPALPPPVESPARPAGLNRLIGLAVIVLAIAVSIGAAFVLPFDDDERLLREQQERKKLEVAQRERDAAQAALEREAEINGVLRLLGEAAEVEAKVPSDDRPLEERLATALRENDGLLAPDQGE